MSDLSDDDILHLARQVVPECLHRSGRVIRHAARAAPQAPQAPHSLQPGSPGLPGGLLPRGLQPSTVLVGQRAGPGFLAGGLDLPRSWTAVSDDADADAADGGPSADDLAGAGAPDPERDLAGLASLVGATVAPPAPGAVSVEFSQATSAGMQSVVVQLVDGKPTRVIQLG